MKRSQTGMWRNGRRAEFKPLYQLVCEFESHHPHRSHFVVPRRLVTEYRRVLGLPEPEARSRREQYAAQVVPQARVYPYAKRRPDHV